MKMKEIIDKYVITTDANDKLEELVNLLKKYNAAAGSAPLTEPKRDAQKVLKAHLFVAGRNLAYLVFCSLLRKTNVLNYG